MLRGLSLAIATFVYAVCPAPAQQLAAAPDTMPAATPRAASTPAWYPTDCAGSDYCAPVDHAFWAAPNDSRGAELMITSLHGTATVQRSFAVKDSRDDRMHVCMRFDPFGSLEVTCLLVPAS